MHLDRAVQPAQAEAVQQAIAGAHQRQIAVGLAGAGSSAQHHAQPAVVERGDAVEVDPHARAAMLIHGAVEVIAERRQRGEIDLAADVQHGCVPSWVSWQRSSMAGSRYRRRGHGSAGSAGGSTAIATVARTATSGSRSPTNGTSVGST